MKNKKLLNFLKSYHVERERRISSIKIFDKKAYNEWEKIINNKNLIKYRNELEFLFNYAKNLNYNNHSNQDYFSHPLRVSIMSFYSKKNIKFPNKLIILALFHNIIENSNYKESFLIKLLSKDITKQIKILTVNRKKEWDKIYKKNYYKAINLNHINTRIVKILDKLDNLFIIGLQKNNLTRIMYIKEIEEYVLPMVKKDIPFLYKYFKGLIKNSYDLGYYGNRIN